MEFINAYLKEQNRHKEERKIPFSYICSSVNDFMQHREEIVASPFWRRSTMLGPGNEIGCAKIFISNIVVEELDNLHRHVALVDENNIRGRVVVDNQVGRPLAYILRGPEEFEFKSYKQALLNYFPSGERIALLNLED